MEIHNIKKQDIIQMLIKAFEEGWYGYKDLSESTALRIFEDWKSSHRPIDGGTSSNHDGSSSLYGHLIIDNQPLFSSDIIINSNEPTLLDDSTGSLFER